jgi:hypothetical protein
LVVNHKNCINASKKSKQPARPSLLPADKQIKAFARIPPGEGSKSARSAHPVRWTDKTEFSLAESDAGAFPAVYYG